MAENRQRLQHMEGAVQHLDERCERLRRKAQTFRHEVATRLIEAIVILPDHLHCIWTLPPKDADFSTRWRLITKVSEFRKTE